MKITKFVNEQAKKDGRDIVYTDAQVMAVINELYSKGIAKGVYPDFGLLVFIMAYITQKEDKDSE